MNPELVQYLIYGALALGGFALRHFGLSVPSLTTTPTQPVSPAPLPSLPAASNGTPVPPPPAIPTTKSVQDFLDNRIALLEQRLEQRFSGGDLGLAPALVTLAHRLLDRNANQAPPAPPPPA